MESLVVTPETAKKLDAAGFPTDPALAWFELESEVTSGYVAPYTGEANQQPAWTAQEIADQLPEALNVIRHTGSWTATVDRGIGRPVVADAANSLAEALANLWLKLREAHL